jgi:Tol biopolymer transport system component
MRQGRCTEPAGRALVALRRARCGCRIAVAAIATIVAATASTVAAAPAGAFASEQVSSARGENALGASGSPSLSGDGRFVAFHSTAPNLVPGDGNESTDVFVRDRLLGTIERVSITSDGMEANGPSHFALITPDGRFVAFRSEATNLVPGDTNGLVDAFVHDRATGTTERVSVASDGTQVDAVVETVHISADGRLVFVSTRATTLVKPDRNGYMEIFLHDRATGVTTRVELGGFGRPNGSSHASSISDDGRYVAFRSYATNLVAGDTNKVSDAFVRDRALGRTIRLSVSSAGKQGYQPTFRPFLSASGEVAVFRSDSASLVPGDTNGVRDVFVRDIARGLTTRVSLASDGTQANGRALRPALSADGRFVVFASQASNLVPLDDNGTCDVFVHDRFARTTKRVSTAPFRHEPDGCSRAPRISVGGHVIAFSSDASNLVPDDTNGERDVFVRER